MKTCATVAALAAGANALALRGESCCFTLTASGGTSGTVGQLNDGQNRIGGGLPPATFCITPGGTITDSSGRGCILTRASPDSGFSVSSSGQLTSNGSADFVACQTGDNGAFNIYTNPSPSDVTGCVHVALAADQCSSSASSSAQPSTPAASPPATSETSPAIAPASPPAGSPASTPTSSSGPGSPPTSSQGSPPGVSPGIPSIVVVTITETVCTPGPSTASPASTQTHAPGPSGTGVPCSTDLVSGNFEFPHLIVPIDSSSPDTAGGTQFKAEVTSTISTIFNFDIPASDAGKTCTLVFHFPEQRNLQTSSFTFSGDGKVDFAELNSPATQSTTFNNAPTVKTDFGVTTIAPGNSY
ncbi:hypothetical protein F66182_14034, partial [Fusarium sp. NRRL 66182]